MDKLAKDITEMGAASKVDLEMFAKLKAATAKDEVEVDF
jgi:hypothetical protein